MSASLKGRVLAALIALTAAVPAESQEPNIEIFTDVVYDTPPRSIADRLDECSDLYHNLLENEGHLVTYFRDETESCVNEYFSAVGAMMHLENIHAYAKANRDFTMRAVNATCEGSKYIRKDIKVAGPYGSQQIIYSAPKKGKDLRKNICEAVQAGLAEGLPEEYLQLSMRFSAEGDGGYTDIADIQDEIKMLIKERMEIVTKDYTTKKLVK